MEQLPHEIRDAMGPWGYVIGSILISLTVAVCGAIGFLAKKMHAGCGWLARLLQTAADKHFAFVDATAASLQAQEASLDEISKNTSSMSKKLDSDAMKSMCKAGSIEGMCKAAMTEDTQDDVLDELVGRITEAMIEAGVMADQDPEKAKHAVSTVIKRQRAKRAENG